MRRCNRNSKGTGLHIIMKLIKYIKEKDFTLQEKIEIPLRFHLVVLFLRYVEREIRKLFD